jgi:hypothetical protein
MRTLHPDYLAALRAGHRAITGMVRFEFGEGTFAFIARPAAYAFGGVTYLPLPDKILQITPAVAQTGTAAQGFSVTLSESSPDGLTPEVIAAIEAYDYRDRKVTYLELPTDPATGAVLGAPVAKLAGTVTQVRHFRSPARGMTAVMQCHTRTLAYTARNDRMRTHQDQQRRAPGDRFYDTAATAGKSSIKWGRE